MKVASSLKVESMNSTAYIANQNVRFFSTTYKRTLISFNAGANWNRITPPVNDTTCVLVSKCSNFISKYLKDIHASDLVSVCGGMFVVYQPSCA